MKTCIHTCVLCRMKCATYIIIRIPHELHLAIGGCGRANWPSYDFPHSCQLPAIPISGMPPLCAAESPTQFMTTRSGQPSAASQPAWGIYEGDWPVVDEGLPVCLCSVCAGIPVIPRSALARSNEGVAESVAPARPPSSACSPQHTLSTPLSVSW